MNPSGTGAQKNQVTQETIMSEETFTRSIYWHKWKFDKTVCTEKLVAVPSLSILHARASLNEKNAFLSSKVLTNKKKVEEAGSYANCRSQTIPDNYFSRCAVGMAYQMTHKKFPHLPNFYFCTPKYVQV